MPFGSHRVLVGGAADYVPMFAADFVTTLVPNRADGSLTPTFTRATTATGFDFAGRAFTALSGEARIFGARRVYNLVATKSEDWTNAAWTKTIGTVTATTLTSTGANQTVLQTYTAASADYVLRVRLSRITGTGNIQLTLDGGTGWTTVTLTGSNQVFSIAQTGVTNPQFGIRIVTSGDAINADQIALYSTVGVTNTNPPEYVSVGVLSAPFHGAGVDGVKYFDTLNGNTVASNVVTEATGAHIDSSQAACAGGVTAGVVDASGPIGFYAEGARTNLALQSQTLDDAAWSTSNSTVTADQTTAPDGTSTADKIVQTTANTTHFIYQNITVTNAATTISAYVKALNTTYAHLFLWDNTTGTIGFWGNFDIATGVVESIGAFGGGGTATSQAIQALPSGWYRISVTGTPGFAALANFAIVTSNATGAPAVFVGNTANGLYGWGAQLEAASFASTCIPTTTVAVARNASVDQYVSASNVPTNNFVVSGETTWTTIPTAASYFLWASYVDADNYTAVLWDGTNLIARKRIAGVNADATKALTPVAGTAVKWAARFSSTTGTDVFHTGAIGTNDATTTACQIGTNFQVGADGNGAGQPFAADRKVRIWGQALTTAKLVQLTS